MMIRLNEYQFKEEYTYYILQSLKEGKKENFRRDFLNMHSMDQVSLFMELDETKRLRAYSFLSPAEFGHIFAELHPLQQKKYILELDHQYAITMLKELPSDNATHFIGLLSNKEVFSGA